MKIDLKPLTGRELTELIESRLWRDCSVKADSASDEQLYRVLASILGERLADARSRFMARTYGQGKKQVYYMSMEFLLGRSLKNNLYNMGLSEAAEYAASRLGFSLERLYDREPDAGLGNGGLGRLAACYLDAAAACSIPTTGYSILYEYGIFKQKIVDGWQTELPDNWLPGGSVWLEPHSEESVEVHFDGELEEFWDCGHHHVRHKNYNTVIAQPHDIMVSGAGGGVSKLRVWLAKSPGIDMASFNKGNYAAAMQSNNTAEIISKVLYPNDNFIEGKILRLRQQYFLAAASIADIVRRHLARYSTLENLPELAAVQINDTHPTLAIPELIRILLDECGYGWDRALDITRRTFSYTNHTVMAEALEKWDIDIIRPVLPRIYEIICEIDLELSRRHADNPRLDEMRIIKDNRVYMANLCVYICRSVNGVSKIHSEIVKKDVFPAFALSYPERFKNVTNGIAYRRWLLQSNPGLCALLDELIGKGYRSDASELIKLAKYQNEQSVLERLEAVKRENKERLCEYILRKNGISADPSSVFEVQVKRLHEYKRQHLNALNIIDSYLTLKKDPAADFVPRTYIFGAKAAPGYYMAKQIIRLLCALSELLEKDADVNGRLKLVFLEDYSVTLSELLMPAGEVSEQISLAGTEASGTGNMKLMLNGAVTLGTADGANIEIMRAAGEENFIRFGMDAAEVDALRASGYTPEAVLSENSRVKNAVDFIERGFLSQNFSDLADNLKFSDPYMVLADFASYTEAEKRVGELYLKPRDWNRMSLMNIASAGEFSADRAVREYAKNIWDAREVD